MADSRKKLCAHIRAAKDWLGRAEHSLEKENDIKGDLNLMLAEAELQRARETEAKKGRRRLLAPAMALLLALGGFALYHGAARPLLFGEEAAHGGAAKTELAVPETLPVTSLPGTPKAEALAAQGKEGGEAYEDAAYESPAPLPAAKAGTPQAPREEEEPPRPAEQGAGLEASPRREAPQTAVPTPDRQKLMLSAGRVLRE